ncbi:MAG TPA: hypothetical protein VIJ90_08945 [Gemmatimonadaceae bacterium]
MIFHLLVALGVAGLTWLVGWWGVAIVALIVGFAYRSEGGRPWRVALGASEGWAILLLIDTFGGRFGQVATTVAGSMSLPAAALLIVTLLFPALIGWSAATVAAALSQTAERQ